MRGSSDECAAQKPRRRGAVVLAGKAPSLRGSGLALRRERRRLAGTEPHLVHRLDVGTSGVALVALDCAAATDHTD